MELPDDVVPYKRTPVFTEETVPDGLRREHATKAGVWGLIHIESGRLRYEIAGREDVVELTPGDFRGVIEPEMLHCVTPVGAVRFFVEFHK
ncbi:MAG: DUF1971 domain-containing protein [Hyphomicrobiaceae bacterium]